MFPKTLGGVSFEKSGKLFGGRKTKLFRCVVFPSPKPPTFPCNDQRGFPFGNPKTCFFFKILVFLSLLTIFFVRDSYTNEYILLLQSVGKNFSLVLKTFSKFVKVFTRKLHQLAVYIFPFSLPSNSILFFKASFIKLTRFCCPE